MGFRKKTEVVKKHTVEPKKEVYVIPQIPEDTVGLRNLRQQFEKTVAVSPMEGIYTKDVLIAPENGLEHDIDLAYDPFRVQKKLTEEDEVRRFGLTNHEFPSIDSQLDTSKYVRNNSTVVKEEKGTVGINFGVVEETIEPKVEVVHDDAVVNPHIHFGQTFISNETDIEFERISISNEIETEQEQYVAKPSSRVMEPVTIKQPAVDETIPKTIVLGKRTEPFEDETPQINIPNFFNHIKEEEIHFDTPVVKPYEEEIYIDTPKHEEIKSSTPQNNSYIYEDKYANYKFPPYTLLNPINEQSIKEPDWIYEKIEIINSTLKEFSIDGEVISHTYGPSVTRYEVKLSSGVNVKKVSGISDNIKMNLSAKTIRIEAPIPGKSNVGIEVPNNEIRTVSFSEIVFADEFKTSTKPLNIALGLNIDGKPVYTSIAKMPHGLIAGGTGSGKSVCVNGLLISLLLKYSPKDLKMILVDPKQVELISYQDLPHLATPVITDPKMASEALKWACIEMDRRYSEFKALRVRDIASFNEKIINDPSIKKIPYLLIVIDELADLMLTCGNDVESSIQRITQLGRAAGVHIIVATQRPTTDVVKGTIKANIPTRIAFRVSQFVDSTTILDQGGAESLLGRGDMLFKTEDLPVRIQGAYISDDEINRICEYIINNYPADYLFTHEELNNRIKQQYDAGGNSKDSADMELIYNVAIFVVQRGSCSVNSIIDEFAVGWKRAKDIVDILQEMGIVSESKGTTSREILVTEADVKQMFQKGE